MIAWPDDLVRDIARRKSVLFLGAGISKNSTNKSGDRPKDWKEFLTAASQRLDKTHEEEALSCISSGDLLTACELVRKFLKRDQFKSLLLSEYSDKAFEPASIHDDVVKLDSRFVLTTNFDKLYENRANQIQNNTVLVRSYYDEGVADIFRRSQRNVLKVHGTIDVAERTVFTRSDYARARIEHGHFYRLLESLFLTHTFIFLGASMKDPDIQLILENHAFQFAGSRPHFMVMPKDPASTAVVEIMEESMNLRSLIYDPADHHKELAASLSELRDLVEGERETLTTTMDW